MTSLFASEALIGVRLIRTLGWFMYGVENGGINRLALADHARWVAVITWANNVVERHK